MVQFSNFVQSPRNHIPQSLSKYTITVGHGLRLPTHAEAGQANSQSLLRVYAFRIFGSEALAEALILKMSFGQLSVRRFQFRGSINLFNLEIRIFTANKTNHFRVQ